MQVLGVLLLLVGSLALDEELANERLMLANDTDKFLANDAATAQQLNLEAKIVKEDVVFGLVSSVDAFEIRVGLLRLW
jgi:hypothetical protein